jgi:tRNA(fMet)-specific endonuclease VapC
LSNERFMLDTDTISLSWRGEGKIGDRMQEKDLSALCVSAITIAELRFGADQRKSSKLHARIDTFASIVEVIPFDAICARHFGAIGSALAAQGTPIGDFDVMIAATAVAVQATLVTNNVKHFARVRGLRVENWY